MQKTYDETVAELKALVGSLQIENNLLRQKVQLLLKRIFGSKTETLNPAQLQLLMSGLDVESSKETDDDPPPPSPPEGRGKTG